MTSLRVRAVTVLAALATLTGVAGCGLTGAGAGHSYSAMFRTATGIYPQADVRMLGVAVGKVDDVVPRGPLVQVSFHVDSDVQVPADAKAVVVAPTVVADRYVQLTPVYVGGPTLADGTVIPVERTASPAEFDDLLAAAQKLSHSLGPDGANATGAVSQALTTAARNLKGNGGQLNTTLDNASQAITTLSANRDNLSDTIRNLQSFTSNLKKDDPQVREFTNQFAQVNGFLADERQNLGDTLKELSTALGDVAHFVHDNRAKVKDNVEQLSDVLDRINDNRIAVEQVLETAPLGLDGLVNGFNAGSSTLDTRTDLLGLLLCGVKTSLPPPLSDLFAAAVGDFFGAQNPVASCNMPGSSLLKNLSPATKAQLADPKVASALAEVLHQRAATSGAKPAAPVGGPDAGLPLSGRGAESAGPVPRPEPAAPGTSLGGLLGGGR